MDDYDGSEGVVGRRMVFCRLLQQFPIDALIKSCEDCNRFLLYCCSCASRYEKDGCGDNGRLCHHFRLVFTDGACHLNGQPGAKAGMGIAGGDIDSVQLSVPITEQLDPGQRRTSQRAELLAAQAGLRWMTESNRLNQHEPTRKRKRAIRSTGAGEIDDSDNWIIATDSEYVVKGMTEWLPRWKNNNLRNNRNETPSNLDLFQAIDEEITTQEDKSIKIGFWHVPREYNSIADGLAKKAS
ncbi:MAG: hypothetical protein Q9222_003418 [Ikaeria aurantiellina]